jgi:hypothetical protein
MAEESKIAAGVIIIILALFAIFGSDDQKKCVLSAVKNAQVINKIQNINNTAKFITDFEPVVDQISDVVTSCNFGINQSTIDQIKAISHHAVLLVDYCNDTVQQLIEIINEYENPNNKEVGVIALATNFCAQSTTTIGLVVKQQQNQEIISNIFSEKLKHFCRSTILVAIEIADQFTRTMIANTTTIKTEGERSRKTTCCFYK